jgi:ADP-ribose pyrophosphatase YjhB (NUDIX family)
MATPRVAAGALFFDESGRILLVKPGYKGGWDIPGGYVEPGESPRAACIREIQEELGLSVAVGGHLVVDWAPAENEGDKLLFVFDAGVLTDEARTAIKFRDGELIDWRFVADNDMDTYLPARLVRRIRTAITARHQGVPAYIEHGEELHPS